MEAARQVMAQPGARRAFAYRKSIVEPVFSSLRERQGFNRLRRRGLAKAKLEFRLQIMAYNLSRIVAYDQQQARERLLAACLASIMGVLQAIRSFWRNGRKTLRYFGQPRLSGETQATA